MLKVLSRGALAVALGLPAAACVDARARFDEFGDRIPIDARPIDAIDAPITTIPDIDGMWLLSIDPKPIAPGSLIQTLVTWDITLTADTGSLDGSYQPLVGFGVPPDSPTARTPVGAPLVANDVAVDNTASFTATLTGTLPGQANTASGTEYQISVNLVGRIMSADVVCGTVTGVVGPIPDVSGSTFGARRSASPLPAPVGECPP